MQQKNMSQRLKAGQGNRYPTRHTSLFLNISYNSQSVIILRTYGTDRHENWFIFYTYFMIEFLYIVGSLRVQSHVKLIKVTLNFQKLMNSFYYVGMAPLANVTIGL